MPRLLVYVVPVALAVYALFDLARSLPEERAGIRRWAWAVVVVLLPVLGPLVWILVSRYSRAQAGAQRPTPGSPGRPGGAAHPPGRIARRPGPVAPDDDPDFLWRLEQQRRRAAGESPDGDGPPPGPPNPPPREPRG